MAWIPGFYFWWGTCWWTSWKMIVTHARRRHRSWGARTPRFWKRGLWGLQGLHELAYPKMYRNMRCEFLPKWWLCRKRKICIFLNGSKEFIIVLLNYRTIAMIMFMPLCNDTSTSGLYFRLPSVDCINTWSTFTFVSLFVCRNICENLCNCIYRKYVVVSG